MVFRLCASLSWEMLCWYWLILMDFGLIFISLVSGFCRWWVMFIVLCSDMFRLGNLRVVWFSDVVVVFVDMIFVYGF